MARRFCEIRVTTCSRSRYPGILIGPIPRKAALGGGLSSFAVEPGRGREVNAKNLDGSGLGSRDKQPAEMKHVSWGQPQANCLTAAGRDGEGVVCRRLGASFFWIHRLYLLVNDIVVDGVLDIQRSIRPMEKPLIVGLILGE